MFARMKEICESNYDDFLSLPNVNGIAIGHKVVDGVDIGHHCLTVYVSKKVDKNTLSNHQIIPKEYEGFITDVVEIGEIKPLANTGYIRPAEGGYSIGVAGTNTAGTLGCLISTGAGSNLKEAILSNNHVIALVNTAAIGSTINQPAPGDGGSGSNFAIANLTSFVSINFAAGSTNIIDCATADVISNSIVTDTIVQIGVPNGIASAIIGNTVQKSGRTTGYTTGTITAVNGTINVNYGASYGVATFTNQIITTPMSSGGDSGSIVLDTSNRVIGLLFAGSASVTACNDIRPVLEAFRSRLVGV